MFSVLHIADFALHAVLRTERDTAHRPAALFAGTSKKSIVLAANPLARRAGVEPGMTAPQAVARCPSLIIRAPRPEAENEARAVLLAIGFTLSPAIEDTAPGICTCDLRGLRLAPEPLAASAVERLGELGLPATAGIARTPLLALYAARAASPSEDAFNWIEVERDLPSSPSRLRRGEQAMARRRFGEGGRARSIGGRQPDGARRSPSTILCPAAGDGGIVSTRTAGSGDPALQRSHTGNVGQGLPTPPSAAPRGIAPERRGREAPPCRNSTLADTDRTELAAERWEEASPSPHDTIVAEDVGLSARDAVLTVADEKHFLSPLPLAAADPSPELAAILDGWGLRTLGDLTALPRDEIVRRFGGEGLALWQRAAGGAPRPLRPVVPPQTFSAQMEFEHEVETLEPLLFVLRRFSERLALELQASQHVAAELHLALRLEDETQHARSFRLPEPTADVEILFRALHTHLESLTTAASIVAVALTLTPARPLVRQQGLFETGLRDPHGFAETLARVSALVGADHVGTPRREDTHRPDVVTLAAPPAVVSPPAAPPVHDRVGLPLRRFRPPLPARVEFTEGRATYLWTEHVRGEIAQQSVPYPSSGDWWQRDHAWARREWDIALAEGGLYRLLLVGDAWFLEGEYD